MGPHPSPAPGTLRARRGGPGPPPRASDRLASAVRLGGLQNPRPARSGAQGPVPGLHSPTRPPADVPPTNQPRAGPCPPLRCARPSLPSPAQPGPVRASSRPPLPFAPRPSRVARAAGGGWGPVWSWGRVGVKALAVAERFQCASGARGRGLGRARVGPGASGLGTGRGDWTEVLRGRRRGVVDAVLVAPRMAHLGVPAGAASVTAVPTGPARRRRRRGGRPETRAGGPACRLCARGAWRGTGGAWRGRTPLGGWGLGRARETLGRGGRPDPWGSPVGWGRSCGGGPGV